MKDVKTLVDIISTVVTTVAVIVGAAWAYFKFVKGRTFRPRLEVGLFGEWRPVEGERQLFHARITVKNIGASVVQLLQTGTGLQVSRLDQQQVPAPAVQAWVPYGFFEILPFHAWIEPGETVSDDLLLDLGDGDPRLLRLDARLIWTLAGNADTTGRLWAAIPRKVRRWLGLPAPASTNVMVKARKILSAASALDGTENALDSPLVATESAGADDLLTRIFDRLTFQERTNQGR